MKKRLILSSLLTILMSASIAAGATYALFTSKSETHVEVGSGKVNLVSEVKGAVRHYSLGDTEPRGDGHFFGGGSATVQGHNVSIDGMTPGDKAEFDLAIKNFSTVAAKYRVKVNCESGYELYSKLNFSYGAIANWTTIQPEANPKQPVEKVGTVTIEMPEAIGNEVQGLTANLVVTVEAVQANTKVVYDDMTIVKPSTGKTTIEQTGNVNLKTDSGAVKVNIPEARVDREQQEAVVNVTNVPSSEQSNFEISNANTKAVYYDIDVTGINASEEHLVDVQLYVGKNLPGKVKVLHKTNTGVEAIDQSLVSYDPTTGYVTFKTKSFSAFAIYCAAEFELDGKGTPEQNGAKLQEAIGLINNEKGNISLAEGEYKLPILDVMGKDITIEGTGNAKIITSNEKGEIVKLNGGRFNGVNLSYNALVNGKATDIANPARVEVEGKIYTTILDDYVALVDGKNCEIVTNKVLENRMNSVSEYTLDRDLYFGYNSLDNNGKTKSGLNPSMSLKGIITLDLNGHSMRRAYTSGVSVNGVPAFMCLDTSESNVTICDNSLNGDGIIDVELGNNSSYGINLKDNNAVLTIKGGVFTGAPTAFQVQHGTLNVEGGTFRLAESVAKADNNPEKPSSKYIINCIDAGFKDKTAKINVTGGTFVGYDVNANPEGAGTTYLAEGYETYQDGTEVIEGKTYNVYKVRPVAPAQ